MIVWFCGNDILIHLVWKEVQLHHQYVCSVPELPEVIRPIFQIVIKQCTYLYLTERTIRKRKRPSLAVG